MRTLTALLLLAAPASAQCLDWSRPFVLPGANATIPTATYFDDGTGERLYVAGGITQIGAAIVTRVGRSNGAGFETVGGGLGGTVNRLRVLDVGAGPALYAALSQPDPHYVYRLDGASWTPLPGITGFNDLIAFDDGTGATVYAASGSSGSGRVLRWTGATWQQLGSGLFDGRVSALAVFDDGSGPKLIAGGEFRHWNGLPLWRLARWNGVAWEQYGDIVPDAGFTSRIDALETIAWQGSPHLAVAGVFDAVGTVAAANVALWDGGSWSPLGSGIGATLPSALFVSDIELVAGPTGPRIAVAGRFDFAGGQPVTGLAAWDGVSWTAIGEPLRTETASAAVVHAIARRASGGDFAIAGAFAIAGDAAAANLARWDGSAWSALVAGQALRGDVATSSVHDDGTGARIYVGGALDTAGGDAASLVARFDGSSWERVGAYAVDNGSVRALASADLGGGRRLYAGGTFTTIGGTPADRVAAWDGASWSAVPGVVGVSDIQALLHDPSVDPGGLYAGGGFLTIGGVAAYGVARFDGTTWAPLGAGLFNVRALAFFDDGSGPRLYAAGMFTGRIARFDGTSWTVLPQGPTGNGGVVAAMQGYDDGVTRRLFVGGQFTAIGGVGTYNIASFDGTAWTTYGDGATGYAFSHVEAFRVFDDGLGAGPKLFASGHFSQIQNVVGFSVLAYDAGGWQPTSPGGGVAGTAFAIDALDDVEGSSLYAFGAFPSTDSAIAHGVARYGRHGLPGCEPFTGATFCAGDGSGAACPCGNVGLAGRGCDNSHASGGAVLDALGQANLVADDVTLRVRGASPTGTLLFFQGTSSIASGAGSAFGDGVRCVGGTQIRLAVRTASGGEARFGAGIPGDPTLSSAGQVVGATSRNYQVWYRDAQPFCTASTFNLSNGLRIRWGA